MKAVLFDLDGILTDTADYHYQAWKKLGAELGIELDEAFNEQLKGISRTESLALILAKGGLEEQFTVAEKEALATKKNEVYKKMIEQMSAKDILPGIKTLLDELKEKGVLLGLASASQNGPVILEKLGLEELFDTIVDPAKLSAGKPHPEIFETGAEQLNVSVQECIGIEDAAAGVQSINSAGMAAIAVGDETMLGAAAKVVASTNELTVDLLTAVWAESVGVH